MSNVNHSDVCSRCGKKRRQVATLVPHKNGFICDQCIITRNNNILKLFEISARIKRKMRDEDDIDDDALNDDPEVDAAGEIDGDPDLPEVASNGSIDFDKFEKIINKNRDIQYIEKLGEEPIDPEAVSLIPKSVAELFCLIPLRKEGSHLVVAFSDPGDEEAIREVRNFSQLDIDVVTADAGDIEEAIQKYYPE